MRSSPGFIILDRTADDTLVQQYSTSWETFGVCVCRLFPASAFNIHIETDKLQPTFQVSKSQGAKHNPLGMLIACIWSCHVKCLSNHDKSHGHNPPTQ